jgi:hypothetical protein
MLEVTNAISAYYSGFYLGKMDFSLQQNVLLLNYVNKPTYKYAFGMSNL